MVGWIIFGVIFLIFALLFCLRIKFRIKLKEELSLTVIVLGIPVKRLLPAKKKRYKLKRYTVKRIEKRRLAAEKAAAKKAEKNKKKQLEKAKKKAELAKKSKQEIKAEKAAKRASKPKLIPLIRLAARLVGILVPRFLKHIHIEIAKIHIRIGSSDAATTAVMYGAAYQAVEYIVMILDKVNHLHNPKRADIRLEPDYLDESVSVDLNITVSLRLASVIGLLIKVAVKAIVGYIKIKPKKVTAEAGTESNEKSNEIVDNKK